MRSYNRVVLLGHLAAEPDIRQTKNGTAVANFPIAINRLARDANGDKKEVTDYHRVVAWGRQAEICGQYLAKGTAVFVEGALINSIYDKKNGERQYKTEISLHEMSILTWKKAKDGMSGLTIEPVGESVKSEEMVVAA